MNNGIFGNSKPPASEVKIPSRGLTITKSGDWNASMPEVAFVLTAPQHVQFLKAGGNDAYSQYAGKWVNGFSYNESLYSFTGGSRISSLLFHDLVGITGAFSSYSLEALTTLSLPALRAVLGNISPGGMSVLTTLYLPQLEYIGSSFNPASLNALSTLSVPMLRQVVGNFTPSLMASLTQLNAPALSFVTGNCGPSSMGILSSLSFPALTYVGSSFQPATMPSLTTFSCPALSFVGGSINLQSLTALTTVSFPSLQYVPVGSIAMTTMTALTTLSLPALRYLGFNLQATSSPSLANVTLPADGTLKAVTGAVTITGAALTLTSVDHILQVLASLDGTNGTTSFASGRTLNLSGGTSATPTNLGTTTTTGSSFVCSGTTCTVNWTAHGYATGDVLRISGITTATNANRYAVITVVNANQFTYTITSQTATGTGTATVVKAAASAKALVTRGVTLTTN